MKMYLFLAFFIALSVFFAGCATSGGGMSDIKKRTGIVYSEGYMESPSKKCVVGKDSKGDRKIVVYDKKTCAFYDAKEDGNVEKVEYDAVKKEFLIYHDSKCGNVPEFR
jgi:hypothetical protein